MSDKFKLVKRGKGEYIKTYVPKTFAELIDTFNKESFVKLINSEDRPNSYIFKGMRGCGKTTTAMIFAKFLNCLDLKGGEPYLEPCLECASCRAIDSGAPDVLDINVADKKKIEDARNLIEGLRYNPAFLKNKVIILDEVQQMTKDAQEALLKAMSDAGQKTFFILCTMTPSKVQKALISRCTGKFNFLPLSFKQKSDLILSIAEKEDIEIEYEDVEKIVDKVESTPRDILAAMQVYKHGGLSAALMDEEEENVKKIATKMIKGDLTVLEDIKKSKNITADVEGFRIGLASYLRACLLNSSKNLGEAKRFAKALECLTDPYFGGDMFNRFAFNMFRAFMYLKVR